MEGLLRSETARPEEAIPVTSRIYSAACEHVELSCATRENHSDTRAISVHALWEGLMTSHLLMVRPLYVKIVQLYRGTRAAGYLTLSSNFVRFFLVGKGPLLERWKMVIRFISWTVGC